VSGLVDLFQKEKLTVFGPDRAAAQLEGSKIYAKRFLEEFGIPTARFVAADTEAEAQDALTQFDYPIVLKADGLAAGKGVIIAHTAEQAKQTISELFSGALVGSAGSRVVIEEFLAGEEVSFIAISDGENIVPLEPSQDHKAIHDGDLGPNTGGMGAYSDSAILTESQRRQVMDTVIQPTIDGMRRRGQPFRGFLYAGLMMTGAGPKVLEFNVRLGDPETQCLLHRMDGDLGALLYDAARGRAQAKHLSFRSQPSVCVVMAASGYPGKVRTGDRITGIEKAEARGAAVFHAGTRQTAKGLETAGGRVLGVTHSGATLSEAIANTYAAVAEIHFDQMQFRTDIGRKGLRR
jgi:phosphoribosylamine---glycine ligase